MLEPMEAGDERLATDEFELKILHVDDQPGAEPPHHGRRHPGEHRSLRSAKRAYLAHILHMSGQGLPRKAKRSSLSPESPAEAWDGLKDSEFASPDGSSKSRPKPEAHRLVLSPRILREGRCRTELRGNYRSRCRRGRQRRVSPNTQPQSPTSAASIEYPLAATADDSADQRPRRSRESRRKPNAVGWFRSVHFSSTAQHIVKIWSFPTSPRKAPLRRKPTAVAT